MARRVEVQPSTVGIALLSPALILIVLVFKRPLYRLIAMGALVGALVVVGATLAYNAAHQDTPSQSDEYYRCLAWTGTPDHAGGWDDASKARCEHASE
jgi:hypothetical protein